MRAEELKGHLDALLLAALEDGPRHGYAVMEALRETTGGRLDLPTGTIYPGAAAAGDSGPDHRVVVGGGRAAAAVLPADRGRSAGAVRQARRLAGLRRDHDRRLGGQAMAEPSLITGYLAALSAQLPAPVVEELADGLDQTLRLTSGRAWPLTCRRSRDRRVRPPAGNPRRLHPRQSRQARRPQAPGHRAHRRRLLGSSADHQPGVELAVPLEARIMVGVTLITVTGLLAAAALGTRYRSVARAGTAGCLGVTTLDSIMITGVTLAIPAITWVTIGAMAASTARIALGVHILRPILTR